MTHAPAASGRPRWRLVSQFLLRRAGFPFALIDEVACPRAAAAAARAVEARDAAEVLRREMLSLFRAAVTGAAGDRVALKALSRWRKRVGADEDAVEVPAGTWPDPLLAGHLAWRVARAAVSDAEAELARALTDEIPVARSALRRFAHRDDVKMALFLLSPGLLDTVGTQLDRAPSPTPDAGERALERRLYMYLQRLCAKNETTSSFGPLTYGSISDAATGIERGAETPSGISRREVFCAFWAAAELARAASADPELRTSLPPRRMPAATITPSGVRGAKQTLALDERGRQLASLIDGERTQAELAQACGMALADAERVLAELYKIGFALHDLEPCSTTAYPLADVIARLPSGGAGDRWRQTLLAFKQLIESFGAATLDERHEILANAEREFTTITGNPARRGAGSVYADRSLLYEDCLGDQHPCRMSVADAQRLESAIAPALDLGAAYGELRHRAIRKLTAEVVAERGGELGFLELASALDEAARAGRIEPMFDEARQLRERLCELVQDRTQGVARLTPADVMALVPPTTGRFASPDIMLEGHGDRYVIGEVHPYVFAWGSQGHFAPDPEAFHRPFLADLTPWGGKDAIATVLRRRRHKGLVTEEFPGRFIEVTGHASRDRSRCTSIGDLRVVSGVDGPVLMSPHGPLVLYAGEQDHLHLRAFAPPPVEIPPVRLGVHTPRIEIGSLVYQRERWDLPKDSVPELGSARGAALWLALAACRRRHGWPRHVFALGADEPKPMCLDLESPFAAEVLQQLAAKGAVGMSEMLPAPASLWLQRSAGQFTSELRLALVRES